MDLEEEEESGFQSAALLEDMKESLEAVSKFRHG